MKNLLSNISDYQIQRSGPNDLFSLKIAYKNDEKVLGLIEQIEDLTVQFKVDIKELEDRLTKHYECEMAEQHNDIKELAEELEYEQNIVSDILKEINKLLDKPSKKELLEILKNIKEITE